MRSKKWLIALLIVAVVAVGLWLWWKAPSSALKEEAQQLKPQLRVASTSITDIDEDKISATCKLIIENNLPIEVTTKRLDYVVYIDSAKVIEDSYTKPITIRSSDTTAITLPVEIFHRKLTSTLKDLERKDVDSANYSMKASFQADVPIAGERNFTMDVSKRLPAFRLLKVQMGSIDIGKVGLKESSIDVVVNIENPNVFPVKMKDGKYKFSIDNDENVMEGEMEELVNIPARSTEPVSMHVDIKTKKVPKLGWKMLFDQKDTQFKLYFSSRLVSENSMFDNSKMVTTMQGTLAELTDAVKKK